MTEKGFFGIYGDTIKFKDAEDLKSKLSKINFSVPPRKKCTSKDRERYCIKYYLEKLSDEKILEFPMETQKTESPDFNIMNPKGEVTGLEITEATNEDYQQALTETERSDDDETLIDLTFFRRDKLLPKGSYKNGIRKKDQELIIEGGWEGDSAERNLIECLMSALRRKLEKLNNPYFPIFNRYELLIYDSCPSSICIETIKLKKVIGDHTKNISDSYTKKFDVVSILRSFDIIYDVGGKNLIIPL